MDENQNSNWISELKKSPIFNMSLSSKELFHSNFIAWILENYPKEMGEKFSKVLGLEKNEKIKDVLREKKNIDLSFELGNTIVYIENKVKSIAYKEQLNKYSQLKIANNKIAKYILLSLDTPPFIENNLYETPHGKQWKFIGYKDFLENFLRPLSENISEKYHKNLIKDYISLMESIDKNIASKIHDTSVIKLYKERTEDNKLLKDVWSLRMHDFFQKAVFENLAKEVYDKLKDRDNEIRVHLGNRDKNKDYTGYICIGAGMTNAVGLLDVSYQFNKEFSFGIQIQGNQYRKFIKGKESKNILKEATRLKNKIFNYPEYLVNKILPIKENKKLKELVILKELGNEISLDFNRYYTVNTDALFLYKYVKLDEIILENKSHIKPNKELVSLIVLDIYEMIKNID